MPRHDRVLVRYRLPDSDQWSALHWCDITRNEGEDSIQVLVVLARDEVMPAYDAFRLLPPEQAKKLLVWDLRGEANIAYGFVFQANNLYRFDFMTEPGPESFLPVGRCWSWKKNNYDYGLSAPNLRELFVTAIEKQDRRLHMETQDNYNYQQLRGVEGQLPALKVQYQAWQQARQQEEAPFIHARQERQQRLRNMGSATLFAHRQRPYNVNRSPAFEPELKHLLLGLGAAAIYGYGLYLLGFTSAWIGLGVVAVAALFVCAAVLGRFPPLEDMANQFFHNQDIANPPEGAAIGNIHPV
ncbi:MAG: hypothetical protein NTU48_06645 [Legionellales bacterium]|nr:hypothetical protein [Legionellales bacterium]